MKGWNKVCRLIVLSILLTLGISVIGLFSQEVETKPATVGQPMPDFTLPTLQGKTVTLSGLKGENVLILFPRGYAAEDYWCTICNYKYAELLDLEKTQQIRKKYNTEILIVLPYGLDIVKAWVESLPGQLEKIRTRKNPAEPDKLDEKGKRSMELYRKLFPKDLTVNKNDIPTPFPILIDAERKLSIGLGIFAREWDGGKVDQNIPSVFIVDKNGTLVFKYLGQNTFDRPEYSYLFKVLEVVNSLK